MANTCFYSVERLKNKPDGELYKEWLNVRSRNIHRDMIQRAEYAKVARAFEKNGVDFLPVKGFQVCSLYPVSDYRFMSDTDILVSDYKKAGEIAKKLGYKLEDDNPEMGHDVTYIKKPFMNLELHFSLFGSSAPFYDYYLDILDRTAIEGKHEHRMTDEQHFCYMLAHMKKHYDIAGTGVRSVADVYLFNKNLRPKLSEEKISEELSVLGLTEFDKKISAIAEKWFGDELVDRFSEEELYILKSGTYGTFRNMILNRKTDSGNAGYVIKRMFPPMNWMKEYFPVLRKAPALLPAVYSYRILRAVFTRRDNVREEIKTIKNDEPDKR